MKYYNYKCAGCGTRIIDVDFDDDEWVPETIFLDDEHICPLTGSGHLLWKQKETNWKWGAAVVKLADTPDSNFGARSGFVGSSPTSGIKRTL